MSDEHQHEDPPTLRQRPVHAPPPRQVSDKRLIIWLVWATIALVMVLGTILSLAHPESG